MSIVLPALAVAFAAFSVWLTVRIVNRRERWAIWLAIAILALLGAQVVANLLTQPFYCDL